MPQNRGLLLVLLILALKVGGYYPITVWTSKLLSMASFKICRILYIGNP